MALLEKLVKRIGGTAKVEKEMSLPLVLKERARDRDRYATWVENHRWTQRNKRWCLDQIEKFSYRPTVSIVMQCNNPKEEYFKETIFSIFNQVYGFSELIIFERDLKDGGVQAILEEIATDPRVRRFLHKSSEDPIVALAKIMKRIESEWILPVNAADVLEPYTVYNLIAYLQGTEDVDSIYADSDLIDDEGLRFDPQFKLEWALGSYFPRGYFQHPFLFNKKQVKRLNGFEQLIRYWESGTLFDEGANHSRNTLHAPGILYHARAQGGANEKPPKQTFTVLMNENLVQEDGVIEINSEMRIRSEPNVPLRILWIMDSLDLDDGSILQCQLARELVQLSRHGITVLATKDGPLRSTYEQFSRVEIAMDNFSSFCENPAKQNNFNVAFVSSEQGSWFPEVLAKIDVPSVWQIRDSNNISAQNTLFGYPATILYPSLQVADAYRDFDLRKVSRILTTGADMTGIKLFKQQNSPFDIRAQLGLQKSTAVVTIVGPTIERKGQKMFVGSALNTLSRNPELDLQFFIVGARAGSYLSEIETMIQQSGKADHFHFIPESESITYPYPYYWISDICVSCSTEETFPRAVLEAMAFKKAVVGTRVSTMADIVEDSGNGFLFDADDSQGLTEHLDFLVQNLELAEDFGRHSFAIVHERFPLKKVATRLEQFLRESIVY